MDDMKWAKRFERCENCRGQRNPHHARGYCTRCYPLILRLENVKSWNLEDPTTLRGYPGRRFPMDQSQFMRIQRFTVGEPRRRLESLRARESQLAGPIGGIDLECQLRRIADLARVKRDVLFVSATGIDHTFTPDQKLDLVKFLNEIEENVRWKGIDDYRMPA